MKKEEWQPPFSVADVGELTDFLERHMQFYKVSLVKKMLEEILRVNLEKNAYREVAIDLSVDWSVENTGEPNRKGCAREVDEEAQKLLSKPVESK